MPYVFVEKQDTVVLNTSCVMDQQTHGHLAVMITPQQQQQQRCKMTFALKTLWASMVT